MGPSTMEALRAQMHSEISERARLCGHRKFACHLPRALGWSRCYAHMLEEPAAGFARCRQACASGRRRCGMPAAGQLCFEHARDALLARMKAMARPPVPPHRRGDALLLALKHHVQPERARSDSCASQVSVVSSVASADPEPQPRVDPFRDVDAAQVNAGAAASVLERWSDSEDSEDGDEPRRSCGVEEDSSGAEDTPLDAAPLRFAGIYTAEEVVREAGEALKRLQALYLGQLKVLSRRLREARRAYLYALKAEKETHCSIRSQGAASFDERRQLAALKAMHSYRRRHGVDAVLHRKLHDKRARLAESGSQKSGGAKCCFAEGGVKCVRSAVPAARHCSKHILNDRHQVLFRRCGVARAGVHCQEPTVDWSPGAACIFHADLQPYQTFSLKKYHSDSDSDADT